VVQCVRHFEGGESRAFGPSVSDRWAPGRQLLLDVRSSTSSRPQSSPSNFIQRSTIFTSTLPCRYLSRAFTVDRTHTGHGIQFQTDFVLSIRNKDASFRSLCQPSHRTCRDFYYYSTPSQKKSRFVFQLDSPLYHFTHRINDRSYRKYHHLSTGMSTTQLVMVPFVPSVPSIPSKQ
jgi:hypothetical protein